MSAAGRSFAVFAASLLAACGALVLAPRHEHATGRAPLETVIPRSFGEWTEDPDPVQQVLSIPRAGNGALLAQDQNYDEVLARTYRHRDGRRVMLTIAYGRRQTQEHKIHRPELCYYAQGFEVRTIGTRAVPLSATTSVDSLALLARNRARIEVVTYWIRIGDHITRSAWDARWTLLRQGLRGNIPDGALVRASSLTASGGLAERELALQHAFLADLYAAVPAGARNLLAGA